MDSQAIKRVSTAIKALLDRGLRDKNGNPPETVFVGPLDDPTSSGFKMHLFLYRIAVNADLRAAEHVVPPADPTVPAKVYCDSLPLDLHFLLTAGTKAAGGELDDLALLGRTMQLLNAATELSGVDLQNDVVHISLDPIGSEEMSRVWALFPTANYRTSVAYLVTPVWVDPETPPVDATPIVEETYDATPIGVR